MINKNTKKDEVEQVFEPRHYYDHELADFHKKIQKFWNEPREVILPNGLSGTARKFRWDDMAVAYGAARKVQHGTRHVYQYNSERYAELNNLWTQYQDWLRKQDWIEGKLEEHLEATASEIPF